MKNYIATIDLGDDSTEFASIIGIRGFVGNRYICESIDSEGNRVHSQAFLLNKSIDGLPANNSALQEDVLAAWRAEEAKRRQAQHFDTE